MTLIRWAHVLILTFVALLSTVCGREDQTTTDPKSQLLKVDVNELEIDFPIGSDAENIRGDLGLRSKGANGSEITWQSSNPSVITNDGIVTREGSLSGVAIEVTLTATLRLDSDTKTKDFVLVVQPYAWIQEAFGKPPYARDGDGFGVAVAMDGEYAVVGAPGEDGDRFEVEDTDGSYIFSEDEGSNSGAAFVLKQRDNGHWVHDAYLKAPSSSSGFGQSVAISETTIVVGSPADNAVHVFELTDSGNWEYMAELTPSGTAATVEFGFSVAVHGAFIVVGDRYESSSTTAIINTDNSDNANTSATNAGAVYIFENTGSSWIQDAYIKPTNSGDDFEFGYAVDISSNRIAVGARRETSTTTDIINTNDSDNANTSGSDVGAVFVFLYDSSGDWFQGAYIKGSAITNNNEFGTAVNLKGTELYVGSPGAGGGGSVYSFTADQNGQWTETEVFLPPNTNSAHRFGTSIGISHSQQTLVIGDPNETSTETGVNNTDQYTAAGLDGTDIGAAFVYTLDTSNNWILDAYIKPAELKLGNSLFGAKVAAAGNSVIAGIANETSLSFGLDNVDSFDPALYETGGNSGAIYFYELK